nr:MAG TPA: hypothetical protein [Caudoviricetes sp.]
MPSQISDDLEGQTTRTYGLEHKIMKFVHIG